MEILSVAYKIKYLYPKKKVTIRRKFDGRVLISAKNLAHSSFVKPLHFVDILG